jgi:EAL domain-containing protein (putative c-di-GMP-specific phosphodiesterase class I)
MARPPPGRSRPRVEDDPTAVALRELGCDVVQGYHYARPLGPADFDAFLARHPAGTAPAHR